MKKICFFALFTMFLVSCHESLEDRAVREARDYTERCCPTPVINYSRTDSVTFDKATRNYTYYCSFVDAFDNAAIINQNRQAIHDGLVEAISTNTSMKTYIDAGFTFTYIVRSASHPETILYKDKIVIKN